MRKIKIGTRGSDLALWQANFTQEKLSSIGVDSEIIIIKTQGDKIQNLSFDKLEGKGFFTKEIEDALLNEDVDLAIHSHKDLETNQPEGLTVACVPDREDAREIIVIRKDSYDANAPLKVKAGAIIGTSSARRKGQIKAIQPDLEIKDLRGNVPTRVGRLEEGYNAVVLALAGIKRLNLDLSTYETFIPEVDLFVPAPAQGALAMQVRESDAELISALEPLVSQTTLKRITAERIVLNRLDGGCQLPLGVHCTENGDAYVFYAEGDKVVKFKTQGELDVLGEQMLNELRDKTTAYK